MMRRAGLILAAALLAAPAAAQVNRSGAGGLGPPSNGSYLVAIIQELKLDRKHGLDFDINLYSDPGTLVSDFAASRTSHIFAAFYNGANFYVRGMKVKLLFTVSTANHAFVSKLPAIATPDDMKGKTLAATASSGFYGMALLFMRVNGLDPRKNVNVINASPAAVQTQLLADKAEIGLLSDPGLSTMVTQGFHLVGDMNAGIRQDLKLPGDAALWYIGAYAHAGWVEEKPERARATFEMWQEAAAFYNEKPDEADRIVARFVKVPVEALQTSRKLGFTQFRVVPAIEEKASLDALFAGFKSVGFLSEVPDERVYYDWKGAK
jgi:ABC-type nitrate/sulfonate/bicarbonate transport system substrate-binding protein